jgi:hypothetical protein
MDKPRISANQRLDLVDITRWLTYLDEAYGDILGRLLGDPEYYSGAADSDESRPFIARNFDMSGIGLAVITVNRVWVSGGQNQHALVYDKDGLRLTGPNSPTSATFTPAAAPAGNRYLIARRIQTADTSESRQHYTQTLGKYAANTNTRNIDSWEVSESLLEGGLANTPAATTLLLRQEGWVDIGTFTMVAALVATLVPAVGTLMTMEPLSWAAPPDIDRQPLNAAEMITALAQIVRRMRYGVGASPREWHDYPNDDACFEEGGGIRFTDPSAHAFRDCYLRTSNTDIVQCTNNNFADGDDLQEIQARGFWAGRTTGLGVPDPANEVGYMYAQDKNGLSVTLEKNWSVHSALFKPEENNVDESAIPATVHPWGQIGPGVTCAWGLNSLANSTTLWVTFWDTTTVGAGVYTGPWLLMPVSVPDRCWIGRVYFHLSLSGAFGANMEAHLSFFKQNVTTGATTVLGNAAGPYYTYTAASPNWGGAGWFSELAYDSVVGGDTDEIADNDTYMYWAAMRFEDQVGNQALLTTPEVLGGTVETWIREASHVY